MMREWTWVVGLAVGLAGANAMWADDGISVKDGGFPAIPEQVTSFGAAIAGGSLYFYGGHTGEAHSYSNVDQGRKLWRIDLRDRKKWQAVATGPPLQGLALVAHGVKLYRIGGFSATNKPGEAHRLWSKADVVCFDSAAGKWIDCPPLPEPRSSFDAAVLGDRIYVIGGWKLSGEEGKAEWHTTAYSLDVRAEPTAWEPLPKPPFVRRALALAAFDNKIYAIGGMRQRGGPTTRVDIYDPATKKWSQGPSLNGQGMTGFGASAFATGGRLYVTAMDGSVQRLSRDGKSWETIGKLSNARFFHRMVPLDNNRLLMIGGASMSTGKYDKIEIIEIP